MDFDAVWNQFLSELTAEAEAAGQDLLEAAGDAAEYAAQRAEHLAQFDPRTDNYGELVEAEIRNVAIRAGIIAAEEGDALDDRLASILQGALRFAAGALRAIAPGA